MRKNYDMRLAALRDFLKSRSAGDTVFIVEGGGEFHVKMDPATYLMQHGTHSLDGKKIISFPHPVEGVDPLSLSLYQLIDDAVEHGKLELPELEGDEA